MSRSSRYPPRDSRQPGCLPSRFAHCSSCAFAIGTRRKRDRGRVVRTRDFSRDKKNGTKKTPSTVPAGSRFFRGRRARSSPHRRPVHRSVHEIVRIERPGAFDLRLDLFPRPVPIKQAFSFLAALGFFTVLVCVSRNVRGASDRRVSRHRRFERVPNNARHVGGLPRAHAFVRGNPKHQSRRT